MFAVARPMPVACHGRAHADILKAALLHPGHRSCADRRTHSRLGTVCSGELTNRMGPSLAMQPLRLRRAWHHELALRLREPRQQHPVHRRPSASHRCAGSSSRCRPRSAGRCSRPAPSAPPVRRPPIGGHLCGGGRQRQPRCGTRRAAPGHPAYGPKAGGRPCLLEASL